MTFLVPQTHSPSTCATPKPATSTTLQPLLRLLKSPRDLILYSSHGRRQLAAARLKNATSYQDWLRSATELDELEGNEAWKQDPVSEDYNYQVIQVRLQQLKDAQLDCDAGRMLFLIRTMFSRNAGNINNFSLYQHSRTGTKKLIEEYIDTCLSTIDRLLFTPKSEELTNRQILESLVQTRQAFGRTALLLSGGATFGMIHIGVLKTLWEADLLPRIISGASAGSIVASVICTKTDEEIPEIIENFAYGDLAVFDDDERPETVLQRLARFLQIGAWIDIKHLTRVVKALVGDITFQEAYYRTRRVLNICVSSASAHDLPRLLNYISSPNVIIWTAVAASCSVPFLFTPASLLAKDPLTGMAVPWTPSPQCWIDGSVEHDLPMTLLSEIFNVNHFIVSQVNPHVAPFMSREDSTHAPRTWGTTLVNFAMAETMHRLSMVAEIGFFRTPLTKFKSVLSQKYSGDITILPEIPYADYNRMLKNPTPEFMIRASLSGERATWPKMSRVRNHCAIELALDRAVHLLRTRVAFSPSQTNLRSLLPAPKGKRRRSKTSDGMSFRRRPSVGKEPGWVKLIRGASCTGPTLPPPPLPPPSPEDPTLEDPTTDEGASTAVDDDGDSVDSSGSERGEFIVMTTERALPLPPPPKIVLPLPIPPSPTNPYSLFMTPAPSLEVWRRDSEGVYPSAVATTRRRRSLDAGIVWRELERDALAAAAGMR